MFNILYINDEINYFSYKEGKIFKFVPYVGTIRNGIIIDINKFYKCFKKFLKNNKLYSNILYNKLLVITPPNFTQAEKYLYKEIFNNLNYKIVTFKSEISYYKLYKYSCAININKEFFYFSQIINGKTKSKLFEINDLFYLSNIINKKVNCIYIYGSNSRPLIEMAKQLKYEYYIFENNENYFFKKLI